MVRNSSDHYYMPHSKECSRRPPAHFSTSLRQDANIMPVHHSKEEKPVRVEFGEPNSTNAQVWFDQSNKQPQFQSIDCNDNDSPYFLRQTSSNEDCPKEQHESRLNRNSHLFPAHTIGGSSNEDYRSVIDDLTIENKMLRDELRRYKARNSAQLEKDRLFEVKIHALPADKRRELENTLRAFTASLGESPNSLEQPSSLLAPYPCPNTSAAATIPKHPSSSSTSYSRVQDSGYASMTGQSTGIPGIRPTLEGKLPAHQGVGEQHMIQNFLHNIPHGLLPKYPLVMTDRQKKKLVVQRLEQLFIGKKGTNMGEHSQPFQQQQVSQSAAKADQAANNLPVPAEGIREAHMRPCKPVLHVMTNQNPALVDDGTKETQNSSAGITDSSDEAISDGSSPDQRPTRPLDLDPDRAQDPTENVEYIRHLGLSTPHLTSEDSTDSATDADGWVYLNLLINMAQLHIINVTPAFVRAAVSEVSQKFQVSRDGQKLRWRGGSKGTQLSSDSGASSTQHSPQESDNPVKNDKQKRKTHGRLANALPSKGQTSVPPNIHNSERSNKFHYKPIFYHRASSGDASTESSDSLLGPGRKRGSIRNSVIPNTWSNGSRSRGRRRHDEGPIVFYTGANFCTDLSGDREGILTPMHGAGLETDDCNDMQDALGCEHKLLPVPLSRTTSGSTLPYRPFKTYECGEPCTGITESFESSLLEENFLRNSTSVTEDNSPAFPQSFNATGLGATRPADHFVIRVSTLRTVTPGASPSIELSRFSHAGLHARKFSHRILRSSLKVFREGKDEESIASNLEALGTIKRSSKPASCKLPVKTKIISTNLTLLSPSHLPAPVGYYNTSDSSDTDSSIAFSETSYRCKRQSNIIMQFDSEADGNEDDNEDESMQESGDSSIDMLAYLRGIIPEGVKRQEEEFIMQREEMEEDVRPIVRSAAATVDEESSYENDSSEDTNED